MNIIGTFMGTKKPSKGAETSDTPPADRIMQQLREKTSVEVRDIIGNDTENVQQVLDAISSLERYGMIVHERDTDGNDVLRLPDR